MLLLAFRTDGPPAMAAKGGNMPHSLFHIVGGLPKKQLLLNKAFEALHSGGVCIAVDNLIDDARRKVRGDNNSRQDALLLLLLSPWHTAL